MGDTDLITLVAAATVIATISVLKKEKLEGNNIAFRITKDEWEERIESIVEKEYQKLSINIQRGKSKRFYNAILCALKNSYPNEPYKCSH